MSWSQRFSVVLCTGFLSSIVVHGFFAILQPKTMVASTGGSSSIPTIARCDPYCHPQSLTDSRFAMALDAIKGKSRASATAIGSSSEQVKEMAAFLSVQLLEKVMNEAMKPGGESTMDIEAVERLTKALQMSSSEPSSETTTAMPETSMGVGKADDVDLGPAETAATTAAAITELASSSSPVTTETKTEDALVSTTDDDDISLDSTENPPIAALTTKVEEEKTVDPVPATENPPSTAPAAKVEETAKVVDPVPKKLVSPPKVPEVAWSPLEVVQSNIPPLRPESIPKKTTPVAEDVEPVADESAAEDESSSEDVAAEEPTISDSTTVEEIDEASDLDTKKAEESFHRRLLQQKLEFDKKEAARIKVEAEAKEETKEEEEEKPKGESTITKNNTVSEPEKIEPESPDLTNRRSPPVISERRVETILALRQPKSSEEASELAWKYARMESLDDRAYALLCDLGMIEEHIDPRDPSYDHSNDDDECEQRFLPRL